MADASAVMPYDYTRLLIAAVLGWLAFGELPTIYTWIGAAIIVTSAVHIAHREAGLRQTAANHAALSVSAKMMGAQPPAEPKACQGKDDRARTARKRVLQGKGMAVRGSQGWQMYLTKTQ